MELHPLRVFLTVATEKSFSRAAEKLLRTQPAISLSVQRLELELGERLIDRSAKDLLLTDAGKVVLDYARRFENLQGELENALAEMRDKSGCPCRFWPGRGWQVLWPQGVVWPSFARNLAILARGRKPGPGSPLRCRYSRRRPI